MADKSQFLEILSALQDSLFQKDVGKALYAAADDVRAESRRSITAGSISGANHVPSDPGDPPNNDTGHLIATHETELVKWDHARVVVSAEYAAALEFGNSRVLARPFLGPATRASASRMEKRLALGIRQAARRAGARYGAKVGSSRGQV